MFAQRGFVLRDFMSHLMHNRDYPSKGRNMPVHYSGRVKTDAVSTPRYAGALAMGLGAYELMVRTSSQSTQP